MFLTSILKNVEKYLQKLAVFELGIEKIKIGNLC